MTFFRVTLSLCLLACAARLFELSFFSSFLLLFLLLDIWSAAVAALFVFQPISIAASLALYKINLSSSHPILHLLMKRGKEHNFTSPASSFSLFTRAELREKYFTTEAMTLVNFARVGCHQSTAYFNGLFRPNWHFGHLSMRRRRRRMRIFLLPKWPEEE